MNTKSGFVAALSGLLALVVLWSSTAWASTAVLFDPKGDAPASADVLSYRVTNSRTDLRVAVHVRNLARGSDITLYVNQAGAGQFVVRTAPVGKGTFTFEQGATVHNVRCHWSLTRKTGAKSTLDLEIPQVCFGSRVGAAWVDLIMWQAGGQGSDNVTRAYVPRT
jgi:hypothetical protein